MTKLSVILCTVIWCASISLVNAAGCGKQGTPQAQSKCSSLNCSGASKACCLKRGSYYCGSHLVNPAENDGITGTNGITMPVESTELLTKEF